MRGSCSTTWPSPMPSLKEMPVKLAGRRQVELEARPGQPREIAGGDHLGDDHRGRFERLDLVVAIVALGAVLHDEHAERASCPQHRNAEEGGVDLLARFRQVGEGRVLLRVGQVERPRAGGDRADQALAELATAPGGPSPGSGLRWRRVRAPSRRAARRASRPRRPCSGRCRARCGRAAPAARASPPSARAAVSTERAGRRPCHA